MTIKQLKNAPAQANGEQGFTVDGRDLYQVTICGLIRTFDEQQTHLMYTIEDGTDEIVCKKWLDSDADDREAEARAQLKEGVMVRVIGQLRSFNHTKSVVAYSIQPITDFNEYTYHFLETIHTHLRHTKGPVPSAKPEGGAYGAPTGGYGAPARSPGGAYAPPAAPHAAAASLNDLVLKFFSTKGESSDMGCTIAEASSALSSSGVGAEQVRAVVDELVNEGHLYSTIDDDHFKATV